MGWPLILALAGTAQEMQAEDLERTRAEEAAKEQAIFDIEAQEEKDRREKERLRMAAMERVLNANTQPLDLSSDVIRKKETDYDPALTQTFAGVGKLAQQLGGYYAASPSTNTGGQSYYGKPTNTKLPSGVGVT